VTLKIARPAIPVLRNRAREVPWRRYAADIQDLNRRDARNDARRPGRRSGRAADRRVNPARGDRGSARLPESASKIGWPFSSASPSRSTYRQSAHHAWRSAPRRLLSSRCLSVTGGSAWCRAPSKFASMPRRTRRADSNRCRGCSPHPAARDRPPARRALRRSGLHADADDPGELRAVLGQPTDGSHLAGARPRTPAAVTTSSDAPASLSLMASGSGTSIRRRTAQSDVGRQNEHRRVASFWVRPLPSCPCRRDLERCPLRPSGLMASVAGLSSPVSAHFGEVVGGGAPCRPKHVLHLLLIESPGWPCLQGAHHLSPSPFEKLKAPFEFVSETETTLASSNFKTSRSRQSLTSRV